MDNTETEAVQQTEEIASPIAEETQQQQEVIDNAEVEQQTATEEPKIPLSALQKERRKRQEAEQRAKVYEEIYAKQSQPQQPVENNDQYETVTKADLKNFENKAIRAVEEKSWVRNNPEKLEEINEKLTEFLKQRPHLTSAIENAPNRYEEAWILMNALTPRQKVDLKTATVKAQKKIDAPASPSATPKAAGINQALDYFDMSDSEYRAFVKSTKKPR